MIRAYHHSGDRFYRLEFPLAELGNALATCGWLLANDLKPVEPTTAEEIRRELDRLQEQAYLDIPVDGWFRRFAMRSRNDAPTGWEAIPEPART